MTFRALVKSQGGRRRSVVASANLGSVAPERDASVATGIVKLTAEERLRGYAQGPPAYIRRRKAIEDLQAQLALRAAAGETFAPELVKLNQLIDRHNRYYPIEANLPIDPRTGRLLERGRPWLPLAPVTARELFGRSFRESDPSP